MRTKFFAGLIVIIVFISCGRKDDVKPVVYDFSSIAMTDDSGLIISGDTSDWKLNVVFTQKEKSLFDSIDFSKIDLLKGISVHSKDGIGFCPNPVAFVGNFYLNSNYGRFNFVIVDTLLNVVLSHRIIDTQISSINFTGFGTGYYRVYYVIQNSEKFIKGMGYGDIKVAHLEL